MKIVTVLGARPQFIKAGSVSREIKEHSSIQEIIVHTGQHYDSKMSDIFFEELQLPKPNYSLGVGGNGHGAMTGQMIEKIEEILIIEAPDWVIIYGDTNSTLAGAIAACKLNIKLAHIEAGLRSYNMKMPEEINRILADRVSQILFCPTATAIKNLHKEGFNNFNCSIIDSGDVMFDGAMFYKNLSYAPNIKLKSEFVLCTLHRAENTDDYKRMSEIFQALNLIASDIQVILPLHPRTKKSLDAHGIKCTNITFIEPVGYLEMVWLINNCNYIFTDSGGLQKEAYFFNKPCFVLRDETEWVELVSNGYNVLTGSSTTNIIDLHREFKFNTNFTSNLFGNGKASNKIINTLINY